jgi:hypothetical protein
MSTPVIGSSPQPSGASGTSAAVTVLKVLSRTEDEVVTLVRLQDGREGVATFNRISGEGTVIIGNTTMNVDVHDTARSLNRQEFDRNYTAPPPPPPETEAQRQRRVDPLSADMNRNGVFEFASNSVNNQTGTKEYLNSTNSEGSGDAVLVYRDPTTGAILQFRDARGIINGVERQFDNAFQHLQALMDKNGDGIITGSELDHVLFQFADGRLVPASDPSLNIQSIDTSYVEVNRQNGMVLQANDAGITLKDGTRIALGNMWPTPNTHQSVNVGNNPTGGAIINVNSTGNTIDDLAFAAAKNPELRSHIEQIQANVRARREVSQEAWDKLIQLWAGVSEVSGSQFGVENWKIEALRLFLSDVEGVRYGQDGHGVQNATAARALEEKFQGFVNEVKLVVVGRTQTLAEVAPVYNIEFNPQDFSSIAVGQTITAAKDKLAVYNQGQIETDGGTVVNFHNGQIRGVSINGNILYGQIRTDIFNYKEARGAQLTLLLAPKTEFNRNEITLTIGKLEATEVNTKLSFTSTAPNWLHQNHPLTHPGIILNDDDDDDDDRRREVWLQSNQAPN